MQVAGASGWCGTAFVRLSHVLPHSCMYWYYLTLACTGTVSLLHVPVLPRSCMYRYYLTLACTGTISLLHVQPHTCTPPTARQIGSGTSTRMRHFLLCGSDQLHDLHSKLELNQPDGVANQLHKCIASHSTGRGVFDGNVRVSGRPGCTYALTTLTTLVRWLYSQGSHCVAHSVTLCDDARHTGRLLQQAVAGGC